MSLLDELRNLPSKSLGGTGAEFIDADTLKKDGESYRLERINAAEVDKISGGKVKDGTAGGAETTDVIHSLANSQGFTNIVPRLGDDGQPVRDPYGRILTDLQDENGASFSNELNKAGAFDINRFATEQDIAARDLAESERNRGRVAGTYEESAFDAAAAQIKSAELAGGAKQLGFRINAENAHEYNNYIQQVMAQDPSLTRDEAKKKATEFLAPGVNTSIKGITSTGESTNPFADSWDQGWKNVSMGAYGVLNMLGEETGWEAASEIGEDGVIKKEAELGQYGRTVLDYTEVDGIGSAFQYLGNNLALSLPQMGVTALATAAAPITGGTSLSVPAALYAGQAWNEMEGEKSAVWAIGAGVAQGTLDMLGLSIATKGLGGTQILKKAVSELQKKGLTKEIAEAQVSNASRRQIAEFTGAAAAHAKSQIAAKQLAMNMTKAIGVGGAGEGLTEVAQESIGYLAAVNGSDKEFDWNDYNNRIISAAIAGGSLGGAISTGSTAYDAGAWADVAFRIAPADQATKTQAESYIIDEKRRNGGVLMSNQEIVADAGRRYAESPGLNIKDRTLSEEARKERQSITDKIGEFVSNPQQLWQGSMRNIIPEHIREASPAANKILSTIGGGLTRTHSGAAFENAKHHDVSIFKNMVDDPQVFFQNTTGKGSTSRKEKAAIGENFYDQMQRAINKDGVFDPNLVAESARKPAILKMASDMQRLGDAMWKRQAKYNPELGYEKNYLMTYKGVNKKALHKNQQGFKAALKKNGYSDAEANSLVDELVNNPEVNSVEDFSVVKGGFEPGSHKSRGLNMAQKPEFKEFMEQDMFANMSSAAKSAARYAANREFIGKDGAVISQLLNDMEAEGIPSAEVDKIAAGVQAVLDAESGNYKRPQTHAGKTAARYQKNFMMFSTMSALPLATISSLVETMLISKGLRSDQIFGKKGSLQSIGKEGARTLWAATKEIGTGFQGHQIKDSAPTELARDLGFYDWDIGAGTTSGVTEVNAWQQDIFESFFKLTGLTGYTNFTRAARAGIGADYVNDKLDTLWKASRSDEPQTNEQREAEEHIRNLGLDIDGMLPIYEKSIANIPLTDAEQQFKDTQMREAIFSFVNDAIVLPQATNRPLIYQDPRFALFTQFQGFIATFTANQIPKLWDEYVKRGTPAMKYNAFALATTMIAMGFVSQHLKDLLKYGGQTPHLEGADYIQRGIRGSGLLGTSERILDQFAPLYEKNSAGEAEWAWNTVAGESAAISYAGKLAGAAGSLLQGDVEQATYQGLRSAPLLGPFTEPDKAIAGLLTGKGWNYKGE